MVKGEKKVEIKLLPVMPTAKGATRSSRKLNTLSITHFDFQNETVDSYTGSHHYRIGAQQVLNMTVERASYRDGSVAADIAKFESEMFDFQAFSSLANKFTNNAAKALKYSHLDIKMTKMKAGVKRGLFGELWGFVPMSASTVQSIRRVRLAEQ